MKPEYFFVILSGLFAGLIVFGGKIFADMGLSLYQLSVLPSLFVFLLLPLLFLRKECQLKKEMLKTYFIFGLISAIIVLSQYIPIILGVPVAVVVLLLYTQPLWTIIFSNLFLKEKITKKKIVAVILVLAGVVMLVNPFQAGTLNPIGLFFALLAGLALSGWVLFGRICGKKGYHPVTTLVVCTFFILVFIALSYPLAITLTQEPSIIDFSLDFSWEIWIYLFLFAVVARMVTHLAYFKGAQKVPASESGVILLLEPVVGAILASLFLGELFTANILLGGAFILAANYLIIKD
ncbi:DMT family transporter [archaeon]|nr:DMT family transporter [archaeon]